MRFFTTPLDHIPNSFMKIVQYHRYDVVDRSNCYSYIPFPCQEKEVSMLTTMQINLHEIVLNRDLFLVSFISFSSPAEY